MGLSPELTSLMFWGRSRNFFLIFLNIAGQGGFQVFDIVVNLLGNTKLIMMKTLRCIVAGFL